MHHINDAGDPGPCGAQPGGCPFGGEEDHYESKELAREAYEKKQNALPEAAKKDSNLTFEEKLSSLQKESNTISLAKAGALEQKDKAQKDLYNELIKDQTAEQVAITESAREKFQNIVDVIAKADADNVVNNEKIKNVERDMRKAKYETKKEAGIRLKNAKEKTRIAKASIEEAAVKFSEAIHSNIPMGELKSFADAIEKCKADFELAKIEHSAARTALDEILESK